MLFHRLRGINTHTHTHTKKKKKNNSFDRKKKKENVEETTTSFHQFACVNVKCVVLHKTNSTFFFLSFCVRM